MRSIARRVLPYAARGISLAARYRPSYSRTTPRRYTHSGVGVTAQHDVRMVYRKRRMPRGRRRMWMRKLRTHRALTMKNFGSRTRLFNISGIIESNTSSTQAWLACGLYGQSGTSTQTVADKDRHNVGMAHLLQIFADEDEFANKLLFGSAVMDCTFVNSGVVTIEMDIYDMVYRGRNSRANFNTDLGVAESSTQPLNNSNPLSLSGRGVTPFDLTELTSQGYKVLTKKKHLLPPGSTATYQIRDPRNHLIDGGDWLGHSPAWARTGLTRFTLVLIKAIPNTPVDVLPQLTYGMTHKYMYKKLEENEDAGGQ